MQNLEHSDGSEKDMGQKTIDGMAQSQHDCMVIPRSTCRSTAECAVRISWTLEQELLSELL